MERVFTAITSHPGESGKTTREDGINEGTEYCGQQDWHAISFTFHTEGGSGCQD